MTVWLLILVSTKLIHITVESSFVQNYIVDPIFMDHNYQASAYVIFIYHVFSRAE